MRRSEALCGARASVDRAACWWKSCAARCAITRTDAQSLAGSDEHTPAPVAFAVEVLTLSPIEEGHLKGLSRARSDRSGGPRDEVASLHLDDGLPLAGREVVVVGDDEEVVVLLDNGPFSELYGAYTHGGLLFWGEREGCRLQRARVGV